MSHFRKSGGSNAEFNRFLERLDDKLRERLKAVLRQEGGRLATAVRAAAPGGESGNLKASVRLQEDLERTNPRVYVKAGGPLTTKTSQAGTYDYANATEFGTQKEPARPFFFPTYRRMKHEIRRNIDLALRTVVDVDLRSTK